MADPWVGNGLADEPEFEDASLLPVDVEFHGDMRLVSVETRCEWIYCEHELVSFAPDHQVLEGFGG